MSSRPVAFVAPLAAPAYERKVAEGGAVSEAQVFLSVSLLSLSISVSSGRTFRLLTYSVPLYYFLYMVLVR